MLFSKTSEYRLLDPNHAIISISNDEYISLGEMNVTKLDVPYCEDTIDSCISSLAETAKQHSVVLIALIFPASAPSAPLFTFYNVTEKYKEAVGENGLPLFLVTADDTCSTTHICLFYE